MMPWRKITFYMAVLLLTWAAYDLLVVDSGLQGYCSEDSSNNGSKPYNDDCFCCCAHIVLTKPTQVEPVQIATVAEFIPSALFVGAEPTGIYHPPRI